MPKILSVVSSPRAERSASVAVADTFVRTFREQHPDVVVDTLDLWTEAIPDFDRDALDAKYAGLAVPMWNFGIPYKLKHLIDFISQKDVLFRFDATGFEGMLKNKRGVIICARGISYATGTLTPESEYDFQKSYLLMWFRFVGVTDVTVITIEQTLMGPEADTRERAAAHAFAQDAARRTAVASAS
jgi:FMN-dependent NADH-azoreductase